METKLKIAFSIIGAAKSGTTWMTNNLSLHPEVNLAKKNLNYFNKETSDHPKKPNPHNQMPISWYLDFFSKGSTNQLMGYSSSIYLWDEYAPKNIFAHNSQIKLIAILRQPAERAF